ncbi:MAG: hypothetical protein NXI24_15315 [bacterium]|nr:hypothetical protein [bacterium]
MGIPGLLLDLCIPEYRDYDEMIAFSNREDPEAVRKLFEIVLLFDRERTERGLRAIYVEYEEWLRKQEWYTPK